MHQRGSRAGSLQHRAASDEQDVRGGMRPAEFQHQAGGDKIILDMAEPPRVLIFQVENLT